MNKNTFNIIMACKGQADKILDFDMTQIDISNKGPYEAAVAYVAAYCKEDIEHYTEGLMNIIMKTALCDFIDTCDKPGGFLKVLGGSTDSENCSIGKQIAYAFSRVSVEHDGKYVHGFGAYLDTISGDNERNELVGDFVINTAQNLYQYKGYEVGYTNPQKGKMIVHYKDTNYLVTVQALDKKSIEEDMKTFDYMFKE